MNIVTLRLVSGYVEVGLASGATALSGGHRYGEQGYFLEPTVLAHVKQDMQVVQEEIFGPVVVALPFKELDEILPLANDSMYGLAAGIWTKDLSKAHLLAAHLQAAFTDVLLALKFRSDYSWVLFAQPGERWQFNAGDGWVHVAGEDEPRKKRPRVDIEAAEAEEQARQDWSNDE